MLKVQQSCWSKKRRNMDHRLSKTASNCQSNHYSGIENQGQKQESSALIFPLLHNLRRHHSHDRNISISHARQDSPKHNRWHRRREPKSNITDNRQNNPDNDCRFPPPVIGNVGPWYRSRELCKCEERDEESSLSGDRRWSCRCSLEGPD